MSTHDRPFGRHLEDFVPGVLGKIGRVFYRFTEPGEL